jgi:5-(carboxyamino)imidazole ribonucleotide synthase
MQALAPGSTIGILGAGQLGRMLALAAARLGFKCCIYSDVAGPACDVAANATLGSFDDLETIAAFARSVDVITYEFENVPVAAAAAAGQFAPIRPGLKPLEVSQDRLAEKRFVSGLGLPVAPFAAVESEKDFAAALAAAGAPAILKTRRLGYDGKGQARLASADDMATAFAAIGNAPATLEGHVAFSSEVSVVLVRSDADETRFYDIPVNRHEGGILHTSTVPSGLPEPHLKRAREIAETVATALEYVGVLAVEMFYVGEAGSEPLIVNEFAPRVHNSGHWTIDACLVSQFENHIRAVAGWPLGTTARHSDARMLNLIGAEADTWAQLAAEPGAAVHLYGKAEARPGRKMGHVTWISPREAAGPNSG